MKNLLAISLTTLLLCSQVLGWANTCSSCTNNQNLLKVATWSVDQTPGFTTNNAERLQGSLSFLSGSTVAAEKLNLVCLQEVYNPSDKQAIINALSGSFQYNFAAPAGNLPDCNQNDTNCNLFNGNSGTLILSSLPIEASQSLTFQAQANVNSNALWVKVTWNGTPVNFFCTDLLPDDFVSSTTTDYESLNKAQTQELLNWINTNVPNNEPVVLAGDFNSGPAVGNNVGTFVNNYNLITGAGYQNALIVLVPAATVPCTTCNVNGQSSVTSHIFVKSNTNPAPCLASVGVIGVNQTVITSNGTTIPISDSNGIVAGICYGTAVVPPSPAPIQSVPIVVQPVQVVSASSIIAPFLAVVASLLAFIL